MGQMVVTMQETFAGIRVVKSFAREEHQEKSFRRSNRIQFDNMMRITRSTEAVSPLVESIAAIGVGFALLYVYFAHLPAAKFMALIAGIFLLYDPIKTLSRMHIMMQRSIQATVEIFRILDSDSSVKDQPDAVALPHSHGALELDRVTFRYVGGVEDALKDFSLKILPGKQLCPRRRERRRQEHHPFSHPAPLRSNHRRRPDRWARSALDHAEISAATDRPRLAGDFPFSRYDLQKHPVRPARRDQEEIYAAAQTAYAHDFIMAQPKGYETVIGDKGCLLSGGQQQRLAIARALLKNAPDPPPRRSHFRARLRVGTANPARARTVGARPHRHRDRASAFHHLVRRPDRRDGERPDQRDRHARGVARELRLLSPPLRSAIQPQSRRAGRRSGIARRRVRLARSRIDRAGLSPLSIGPARWIQHRPGQAILGPNRNLGSITLRMVE